MAIDVLTAALGGTVSCGCTTWGTTRWSGPKRRSSACGHCGMRGCRPRRSVDGWGSRKTRWSARRIGWTCRRDRRRSGAMAPVVERPDDQRRAGWPARRCRRCPALGRWVPRVVGPQLCRTWVHSRPSRPRPLSASRRRRRVPTGASSPAAGRSASPGRGASGSAMRRRNPGSRTARTTQGWHM